jgi:hypothetical protein
MEAEKSALDPNFSLQDGDVTITEPQHASSFQPTNNSIFSTPTAWPCKENNDEESYSKSEAEFTANNPIGPATDSGYASVGRSQETNRDERGEDEDDNETVFTDNQDLDIAEDVKQKLCLALSSDITQHLHPILSNWDDNRSLRKSLADLLKDFSVRLRHTANLGDQKDATVFVRHYR